MTAFLTDNFTGSAGAATAHTADTGQGWVDNIAGGTMVYGHIGVGQPVLSGAGVLTVTTANNAGEIWCNALAPTPDYYIDTAIHRAWQSGHGERTAIGIRCFGTSSANFSGYVLEITPASTSLNNGNWIFDLRYAGAGDITSVSVSLGSSPSFTARLQVVGSLLTVSVNGGANIISVTDTNFTAAGAPLLYVETDTGGTVANNTIDSINAVNLGALAFWTDFVKTTETL